MLGGEMGHGQKKQKMRNKQTNKETGTNNTMIYRRGELFPSAHLLPRF